MTQFQLLSLVLFVGIAGFSYRAELLNLVKSVMRARPVVPSIPEEDVAPSVAVLLVNDIINVTELRDKLAAQSCKEGVDACTTLLRVIVEHEQPAKTVNI